MVCSCLSRLHTTHIVKTDLMMHNVHFGLFAAYGLDQALTCRAPKDRKIERIVYSTKLSKIHINQKYIICGREASTKIIYSHYHGGKPDKRDILVNSQSGVIFSNWKRNCEEM